MDRVILHDGDYFEVACSVRADGTIPVLTLLAQLDQQVWPDPDAEELPDSYQVKIKRRFLAEVQHLADYGEPAEPFNHLVDGIWEIKIGTLRVTFYDTDGSGNYLAKISEPFMNYQGKNEYPFPEDFDEYLRLGHYFGKDSPKTLKKDLDECQQVREEDLQHDRDTITQKLS